MTMVKWWFDDKCLFIVVNGDLVIATKIDLMIIVGWLSNVGDWKIDWWWQSSRGLMMVHGG